MEMYDNEKMKQVYESDSEPLPDMARCCECKWEGTISDCIEYQDGDWEYGYYTDYDCPCCEDGGEIECFMSDEKTEEWFIWEKSTRPEIKSEGN